MDTRALLAAVGDLSRPPALPGPGLILSATGHRPDKIGGYGARIRNDLRDLAIEHIGGMDVQPDAIISGMALGWDTAIAEAALDMMIPLIAAIPFRGQDASWPDESRGRYRMLLSRADQVIEVCSPGYEHWKMQERNRWMVDHSHEVLALWDGSSGGTANCVRYAKARGVKITNLWQRYGYWR